MEHYGKTGFGGFGRRTHGPARTPEFEGQPQGITAPWADPQFLSPVPPSAGGVISNPPGFVFLGDAGDKSAVSGVLKVGSGGYTYRQYPNGNVDIVKTPRGSTSITLPADPNNSSWVAITAEIGPTKTWEPWFRQKGLWPMRKRSSAASASQAAAYSVVASTPSGASGARGQRALNVLQSASGILAQLFGPAASAGQAPPIDPTTTLPAEAPAEDNTTKYLLYGGLALGTLVVVGLLLSGKKTQAGAAP